MKGIVKDVITTLFGAVIGAIGMQKINEKAIVKNAEMSDKHLSLFLLMNQWVKIKQEGKNLSSYFEENGYHEIAIYGISYAGETLVNELAGSTVKIKYAIDRNADNIYVEINVLSPEDELEDVDAIVVTAIKFFDEIEEMLSEKVSCPIISLEDILYEI